MRFKTFFFMAILTALIMAAGYYLGGQNGVIYALVISAVMNFGTYWFSDKLVLAMYRARPVSENEQPLLHGIVAKLAQKMNIPKPRIYMVNLPVPNAFATGRNKNHAVVAVTPAILQILNEKELEGVLAHELGHVQNRDILISSIAATLAGAISYLAQMAHFAMLFGGGRGRDERGGGHALGAILMLILTPIAATLIHLAISRSREYLADETAVKTVGDPEGLASALQKLHSFSKQRPLLAEPKYETTAHLFIVNPFKPSILMKLFSTHPSLEERVRRLKSLRA